MQIVNKLMIIVNDILFWNYMCIFIFRKHFNILQKVSTWQAIKNNVI